MNTQISYYRAVKFTAAANDKLLAFSDYHDDITKNNITYMSDKISNISDIENHATLASNNVTIELIVNQLERDFILYNDNLVVELSYLKVVNNIVKDIIVLYKSKIHNIKIVDNKLIIDMNSVIAELNNAINSLY